MRRQRTNANLLIVTFLVTLLVFGVLHFLLPEDEVSEDEARRLSSFPELSYTDALTGQQAVKIEGWYNDQFPFRKVFISADRYWRATAYPNLNAGGAGLFLIPDESGDDLDPDPEPEPTLPPDPGTTDPSTQPSESQTTTQPVEPPPLDPIGEVVSSRGLLIINNRAMERYYGNEDSLTAYAGRLNALADKLGAGVQLYSLLAPTAIELYAPEEYHSGLSSQTYCMSLVREGLKPGIRSVKAYEELLLHRDKYIYYRTDHHWTGLGAYYAYQAFCDSAGLEAVPLEAMEHYEIEGNLLGSLYRVSQNEKLKNNPDTTEGWRPRVDYKATAWDDSAMTVTYQVRLNDERSKGANSYLNFSGGDRALLKIETSHQTGRRILVIKDSFGNALVPYLINHYDQVLVIDPRYYVKSLVSLVQENEITDLLVLNYMFGTSNATWLKGFDLIAK